MMRGGKVVVKIPLKDLAKPESSGLTGADRLFESDDEEDDAELKEQIEAAYKTADTIDELKLLETSLSSDSGSSDSDDDNADLNETKQYFQHQETEGVEETSSGPATTTDPPAALADSSNPGGPGPDVRPEENPSKTTGTKGKGPNSEKSGKAPASKSQLSASAEGVRERAQSMLFGGAALAQAMGSGSLAVWRTIPACWTDCRSWWGSWPMATRMPRKTSGPWWPPHWTRPLSETVLLLQGLPRPLPSGPPLTSRP